MLKHSGAVCYPLSYQEDELFGRTPAMAKLDNGASDAAGPHPPDALAFDRGMKPVEAAT